MLVCAVSLLLASLTSEPGVEENVLNVQFLEQLEKFATLLIEMALLPNSAPSVSATEASSNHQQ